MKHRSAYTVCDVQFSKFLFFKVRVLTIFCYEFLRSDDMLRNSCIFNLLITIFHPNFGC